MESEKQLEGYEVGFVPPPSLWGLEGGHLEAWNLMTGLVGCGVLYIVNKTFIHQLTEEHSRQLLCRSTVSAVLLSAQNVCIIICFILLHFDFLLRNQILLSSGPNTVETKLEIISVILNPGSELWMPWRALIGSCTQRFWFQYNLGKSLGTCVFKKHTKTRTK